MIINLGMKYLIKRYKKELVDKSDISRFIDNFDLYKKIATLATKAEPKQNKEKQSMIPVSYMGKVILKIMAQKTI